MLGEAGGARQLAELADGVTTEASEQIGRHERVAFCKEPLADGVQRSSGCDEEELECVRVGADRLVDRLAVLPVRGAAVGARQRVRWIHQARRPRKRKDEY